MSGAKAPDREWIALRDGVAHAQPKRGHERTACGKPRIDPRYAHPTASRCPACLDRVGITVAAPVAPESESELRAAFGDR